MASELLVCIPIFNNTSLGSEGRRQKGFRSFDGFEIKGFKINAIRINDSN